MSALLTELTPWTWLVIASLLLIVEVFGTAGYFLWFGISAALVAAVLALIPLPWTLQLTLFGCLALVTAVIWWKRLKLRAPEAFSLNNLGKEYLGREVLLHEAIINGRGKIRLNDSFWLVEGPELAAGSAVRITGQNGVIFKVEPASALDTN
ncbi:NfeD family protein [Thiopseudomonas alkaliphila]|uniref:NfeD-like C-terminal domain-containing protein n=1 Tax=Thiopseudomonas alkaliphila TaxID=1697053 RepID=A0A0K1XEV7_9GAMM|nr:NfeD family protein [Thiopseudomonas alkaliphila]AKX59697.1 hypothetical protein AKN88_06975 [Thiopseudomonas alkaliphila]MDM1716849.1 NfeD family protein [Thiopseudomonas alkaliphila]